MKSRLLILYSVLLMVFPLAAQNVPVLFDEEVSVDTTVIIDGSTRINTSVSSTPYRYQWKDVRNVRDSLRTTLRTTRFALRSGVRQLRDRVRSEVFATIDSLPHDLRIGWGDMMFENLIWREIPYSNILPNDYVTYCKENYRYTQHLFVEYLYNIGYWYSVGLLVDYSGVVWDDVTRNGKGNEIARISNQQYHNIVLMPIVRYAYYHSEYVSLYSALGVGLNINTGTEIDYKGHTTAMAPALNLSLLGVRVGKGRWFGAVEIGGMISLVSSNEVYMLGSRIFTASVGCRM